MIKKTIAGILLVTITLTTCGWFLFIPRKAQAIFGVGDINLTNIDRVIKDILEAIVSKIVSIVKQKLKEWLINRIEAWGRGEITGKEIFQEMPWEDWVEEAWDEAAGEYLNDFFGTNLCKWTNPQFKVILKAVTTGEGAKKPECTLSQIRGRLEEVFDPEKDDSWEAFIIALEPQNNDLGIYIMAQGGTLAEIAAAHQAKIIEVDAQGEYKAQKECEEWACVGIISGTSYPGKCEEIDLRSGQFTSECIKYKTVQPAAEIASTFEYTATIELEQIVHSRDLAEILAAFVSALMRRFYRDITSSSKD